MRCAFFCGGIKRAGEKAEQTPNSTFSKRRFAVFDVKKLVEGILAFVNFFVVRIAVSCVVVLLVYSISGQYYFDLASAYIKASPLREQDLKSYIARASEYVTESNVQNALFVV